MKNYIVITYSFALGLFASAMVINIKAVDEKKTDEVESLFTNYYEINHWKSEESVSGKGSTVAVTETVRRELEKLINAYHITSIADAPCGDFNWMKHVNLGNCKYIGMDIVKPLIKNNIKLYGGPLREFKHRDLIKDPIDKVDLILCRDMMVHLTFQQIFETLKNFKKSGSRYLLMTTNPLITKNGDIETGNWRRLNFTLPPFNFPQPLALMYEKSTEEKGKDKHLGLWLLETLPI